MQSFKLDISSVRYVFRVQLAPGLFVFKATDYRLDPLASLLVGVVLLWGVGILEGFPPRWREAERGVALLDSPTVSDMSEHTDWMSEMSKSEASLPLRLLPRLPALLPGRLEFLLESRNRKWWTRMNKPWTTTKEQRQAELTMTTIYRLGATCHFHEASCFLSLLAPY